MGAEPGVFIAAPPRRRRRGTLLLIERMLLLVALAALGYVAGTLGGAALYQRYESGALDDILRTGPHSAVPPGQPAAARPRRVIGRIEIPRLGVSTMIKEGEDARTLDLAVGHIRGTALPGAPGNIGLAGHRDTFFRRLQHIKAGDVIRLVAPEGLFSYIVERTHVVAPDDVWVLDATAEPALTLVTCYPFTYVGTAPERFIVRARLVPATSTGTLVQVARRTQPARPPTTAHKRPRTSAVVAAPPPAPPAPRKPRPIVWWHTIPRGH
jgi:sortase A